MRFENGIYPVFWGLLGAVLVAVAVTGAAVGNHHAHGLHPTIVVSGRQ